MIQRYYTYHVDDDDDDDDVHACILSCDLRFHIIVLQSLSFLLLLEVT